VQNLFYSEIMNPIIMLRIVIADRLNRSLISVRWVWEDDQSETFIFREEMPRPGHFKTAGDPYPRGSFMCMYPKAMRGPTHPLCVDTNKRKERRPQGLGRGICVVQIFESIYTEA